MGFKEEVLVKVDLSITRHGYQKSRETTTKEGLPKTRKKNKED